MTVSATAFSAIEAAARADSTSACAGLYRLIVLPRQVDGRLHRLSRDVRLLSRGLGLRPVLVVDAARNVARLDQLSVAALVRFRETLRRERRLIGGRRGADFRYRARVEAAAGA